MSALCQVGGTLVRQCELMSHTLHFTLLEFEEPLKVPNQLWNKAPQDAVSLAKAALCQTWDHGHTLHFCAPHQVWTSGCQAHLSHASWALGRQEKKH